MVLQGITGMELQLDFDFIKDLEDMNLCVTSTRVLAN